MLYTDYLVLLSILRNGTNSSGRIFRWLYRLREFNFKINHIPGTKLKIADSLSRAIGPLTTLGSNKSFLLSVIEETVALVTEAAELLDDEIANRLNDFD